MAKITIIPVIYNILMIMTFKICKFNVDTKLYPLSFPIGIKSGYFFQFEFPHLFVKTGRIGDNYPLFVS